MVAYLQEQGLTEKLLDGVDVPASWKMNVDPLLEVPVRLKPAASGSRACPGLCGIRGTTALRRWTRQRSLQANHAWLDFWGAPRIPPQQPGNTARRLGAKHLPMPGMMARRRGKTGKRRRTTTTTKTRKASRRIPVKVKAPLLRRTAEKPALHRAGARGPERFRTNGRPTRFACSPAGVMPCGVFLWARHTSGARGLLMWCRSAPVNGVPRYGRRAASTPACWAPNPRRGPTCILAFVTFSGR